MIAETAADRDADDLLPKAVRTYCAVIAHHLGALDTCEPAVARELKSRGAAALGRLPQRLLDEALDAMDVTRATRVRRLRRRPAAAKGASAA